MVARWNKIMNRDQLLVHGPAKLRNDAVDIIEHAIQAADPYKATKNLIQLDGDIITIGTQRYNLGQWENLYIVGAGKASHSIAIAFEEILEKHITGGLISIKQGETHSLNQIRVIESGHPVPNENSFFAAQEILKIARAASKNDVVFSLITGGSSSLLVSPVPGISLEEKRELNRILLNSGASIREINAVRKHLSQIKGGRLALEIFPAELINLTVSDVIGDPLDYITGPTVPDTSTWEDAVRTMDNYDLWDKVPASINRIIREKAGDETPKRFSGHYSSYIVVPGDAACIGAMKRCMELGYVAEPIALDIEGESSTQATDFVSLTNEVTSKQSPNVKVAVIAGGETTVTIDLASGMGGPNQEFALCAAMAIDGRPNTVVAAVGTDGTDGPGDASGGLVDGNTLHRARSKGLDPKQFLSLHDSRSFLAGTGDLIITGPTGTNVNDLMFLLASN